MDSSGDAMSRGKLVIPGEPLQTIPELAVLIGLNEAIFLQQLHYWLLRYQQTRPKRQFIYNTLEEWQTQFPFWSTKTIQRIIKSLVAKKLVRVKKFNLKFCDRTNSYTIDYQAVEKLKVKSRLISEQRKTKNAEIGFRRRRRYGHSVPTVETD
jgi:hypothetical protein